MDYWPSLPLTPLSANAAHKVEETRRALSSGKRLAACAESTGDLYSTRGETASSVFPIGVSSSFLSSIYSYIAVLSQVPMVQHLLVQQLKLLKNLLGSEFWYDILSISSLSLEKQALNEWVFPIQKQAPLSRSIFQYLYNLVSSCASLSDYR